ncbi:hypothetical protein SAY87_013165 [Trapa incisa]|uniref:Remorin C-terminal domain-containing protein n=1 Tax=Trapa incisa TaxID=236973 RepID=A0AAN7QCQ9_9MYRT|nr:hypothetical protein SAY87_013165 [Trapa incisa]
MWCGSSRGGVMSDSDDDDFKAAAVAAAAFAVNALEEYSNGMITEKKPPSPGPPAASLMEYKATQPLEPDASPPRTSGEASREKSDIISMGGSGAQETANLQRPSPLFDSTCHQIPYLQPPPPPPLPAPLFPKNFSTIGPKISSPRPDKLSTPSSQSPHPRSSSRGNTMAEVWEMTEMEKIRERYEKLNETIASWEEGKKKKAKARLDRTESGPPQRRLKAMERFNEEMESIEQIAGGARTQAERRQKKEVLKVKKKADEYRRTGKFPRTCLCF